MEKVVTKKMKRNNFCYSDIRYNFVVFIQIYILIYYIIYNLKFIISRAPILMKEVLLSQSATVGLVGLTHSRVFFYLQRIL